MLASLRVPVRVAAVPAGQWVVDGKQPSGKTKDLYGSAVLVSKEAAWRAGTQAQHPSQPGLLGAATSSNKSKWHNVTRPEALAARAGGAGPRIQVQKNQNQSFQPNLKLPRNGLGLVSPSAGIHITRSWRLDRYRRQHANLSPGETSS